MEAFTFVWTMYQAIEKLIQILLKFLGVDKELLLYMSQNEHHKIFLTLGTSFGTSPKHFKQADIIIYASSSATYIVFSIDFLVYF